MSKTTNEFLTTNYQENINVKILTIGSFSPFFNNELNFFTKYLLPKNKWRKTKYFHSWGWATSRQFWNQFTNVSIWNSELEYRFSQSETWTSLSQRKKEIWKSRFARSWDFQVQGNLFLQDGYNLFPYYRLAVNEGLGDPRATHTIHKKPWHIFGTKYSKEGPAISIIKSSNIFWRFFESNTLAADGFFTARGRKKGIRTILRGLFKIAK
jgi:hypothetical protein